MAHHQQPDNSTKVSPRPVTTDAETDGFGVYVHFPYCTRKCPYCDFASFEPPSGPGTDDDRIPHERYANAVISELAGRREALGDRVVHSIFFGGGTPSLWQPSELLRVREAIVETFPTAPDLEVTAECNPASLTLPRAQELVDGGVTRLSVGVQGLDPARLAFLGRLHSPELALDALAVAKATGASVNADLIYGVATDFAKSQMQRPESAAAEACAIAALDLDHVSAYALTIEPNTDFGRRARRGNLPMVEDDIMANTFEAVGAALAGCGFERYEISNWARLGAHCQHNLNIWHGHDYLGLGCAAYGTLTNPCGGDEGAAALRRRNPPNPERYLEAIEAGDLTPHETDHLPPETRMRERLMLGLRLRDGFPIDREAAQMGIDPWPSDRARRRDELVAAGRLVYGEGRLAIPPSQWIYADGIVASLF